MTKEELINIVKEVLDASMVEKAAQEVATDSVPVIKDTNINDFVPNISNGYLATKSGSVFNTKTPNNPWVHVSKDVDLWMRGFIKHAKNRPLLEEEQKALMSTTDESGGYLVPDDFRAAILMYEAPGNIVWPRATVWPMSTATIGFPKLNQTPTAGSEDHFAGVSFAWTDEGGQKEETEPTFQILELAVHELAGYSEITDTLLEDSAVNLMNFLTKLFATAYQWITDKVFISGNGVKKPLGVLYDPMVTSVFRTTSSTVCFDDVLNMEKNLPSMFDTGAVWFMTKAVRAALRGQKDDNGALLLIETFGDLTRGYDATMLGYPVIMADGKIPSLGTTGDLILGNWQHYYIGDRKSYSLDVSKHAAFRNNKTAVRMSGRIDGRAATPEAFVILNADLS